jgi:hypothetical protein
MLCNFESFGSVTTRAAAGGVLGVVLAGNHDGCYECVSHAGNDGSFLCNYPHVLDVIILCVKSKVVCNGVSGQIVKGRGKCWEK